MRFDLYAGTVDEATCFLNSGPLPEIVFAQQGGERTILQQLVYDQLMKSANP